MKQAEPQQQAPRHPLIGQGWPGKKTDGVEHWLAVVWMHEPSGRQQAPGQGLGVHVVAPTSVVPWGQGPRLRKQTFTSQQARCCGQVLGVQVPLGASVEPVGH